MSMKKIPKKENFFRNFIKKRERINGEGGNNNRINVKVLLNEGVGINIITVYKII